MLANVLLRTQGKNQLLVAETDLNVSLTAELKSQNAAEGGITLGARTSTKIAIKTPHLLPGRTIFCSKCAHDRLHRLQRCCATARSGRSPSGPPAGGSRVRSDERSELALEAPRTARTSTRAVALQQNVHI
jgi:hypothetical protein